MNSLTRMSFVVLMSLASVVSSYAKLIENPTAAEFNSLIAKGNVVVDFFATWCGPCKRLGPVLHQIAEEPAFQSVTFIKLDVDKNPDLTQQYGVRSMPTILFFSNGKELGRSSGFNGKVALETSIRQQFGLK